MRLQGGLTMMTPPASRHEAQARLVGSAGIVPMLGPPQDYAGGAPKFADAIIVIRFRAVRW